jgi:lipoate-protein ligase A
LASTPLPGVVHEQVAQLAQPHTTEDWLLRPGKRLPEARKVKIATGVEVTQRVHKAPGGLIRATVETQQGQIVAVGLSGDFFFYPADKLAELENYLVGARPVEVEGACQEFYRINGIDSPGVTPYDLAIALGAVTPES